MTFEFKYLGTFEFIIETNTGYESGDQEGAFYEKKQPEVENLVQVYL